MFYKSLKIILFFILLFFSTNIFADTKITLESNEEVINVGETFNLNVNIETNSTGSLEIVNIDGLETFSKIGQQSSNQTIIINNERKNIYGLQLTLKANESGSFIIGPTKLQNGNNVIVSNTLNIKVDDLKIVNESNDIEEEESENNLLNNIDDDIRSIKNPNSSFYWYIFFQVLVILLLIGIYINDTFYSSKKKQIKKEVVETLTDKKKEIIKSVKILSKDFDSLPKSIFYGNLNTIFRKYFIILGINNSDKLTLAELKNTKLDKSLIALFEKSYLNEFNDKNDNNEEKLEITKEFLKLLK